MGEIPFMSYRCHFELRQEEETNFSNGGAVSQQELLQSQDDDAHRRVIEVVSVGKRTRPLFGVPELVERRITQ